MRQSGPMEARRGGRPAQVRPRPSSPGPTRGRIRPAAPSPTRLSRHRTIERRRGLPLVAKLGFAVGIFVLAWVCLAVGLGLVGPAASSVVKGFGSMVAGLTHLGGSPTPSASGTPSDAPVIDPPDETIVNVASVDLTVHVPSAVVGQSGYKCRLYVAVGNAAPAKVTEAPVGGTSTMVFSSVALAKGQNSFTATVMGPAGESSASQPVVITLDVSKPKIAISSPKNGASVTGTTITVKGATQAASNVRLQNDANGATANATADDVGNFSMKIAIAPGPNNLTITVTDPAGNSSTATIAVSKGSGQLRANLTSSAYQFTAKKLPSTITLTAVVVGADGKPAPGATALFTISVPGLPAVVSSPILTDATGTATFSTTIPKGAMAGSGVADVLITMPNGKQTTAKAALSVR